MEAMIETDETKFAPIALSKIQPNQPVAASIFLRIGEKFIQFKNQGDDIPSEKYDLFLSKNVSYVYILLEDMQVFKEWQSKKREDSVQEVVNEVGEEHRELAEIREDLREKTYEVYADEELNSSRVDSLKESADQLIEQFKGNKVSEAVLAKLLKHSESLADHCVNTANIAVYLGMALGQSHHLVLENLYMGSILHDYGKAKIPPNILENPGNAMYSQAINDHPIKGAKMAKKIPDVHDSVITIIAQHHEQFNGEGYPKGLGGDDIYELAKIVSIANYFDNVCQENARRPESERFTKAIKAIEYDRGKQFDPDLMGRVMDALKLAYGNYYKD